MRADYIIEPILLKEAKQMNTPLLFDQLTVYEISGKDARTFLGNQVISTLPEDKKVTFSAICNPKGRILFTLFIFSDKDKFLVAVNNDLSDNFFHYMSLRKFRMDFEIKESNKLLKSVNSNLVEHDELNADFLESKGEHLLATEDQFWQFVFSLDLPWITQKTSELFIPQHLNLDQRNIIAFDKGCYPGQEIIARLHYIGKVKKRMQLLTIENPVDKDAGESIYIESLAHKVEMCSPCIKTTEGWKFQAICPVE